MRNAALPPRLLKTIGTSSRIAATKSWGVSKSTMNAPSSESTHTTGTKRYGTGRASSMLTRTLRRMMRHGIPGAAERASAARRTRLSAAADDLSGGCAGRREDLPLVDRCKLSTAGGAPRGDRLDRNERSARTRGSRARFAADSAQALSGGRRNGRGFRRRGGDRERLRNDRARRTRALERAGRDACETLARRARAARRGKIGARRVQHSASGNGRAHGRAHHRSPDP